MKVRWDSLRCLMLGHDDRFRRAQAVCISSELNAGARRTGGIYRDPEDGDVLQHVPNRIGEAIYQGLDYLSLAQPCSAFWRSSRFKYDLPRSKCPS